MLGMGTRPARSARRTGRGGRAAMRAPAAESLLPTHLRRATFPALYLMSTTRFYLTIRVAGASVALAAAAGWGLDRTGALPNPLAGVEDTVVAHPWHIVVALTLIAGGAIRAEQILPERRPMSQDEGPPPFSDLTRTQPSFISDHMGGGEDAAPAANHPGATCEIRWEFGRGFIQRKRPTWAPRLN